MLISGWAPVRETNDRGWSLFQAGQLKEAEEMLLKAVAMDPTDELARENLRICRSDGAELQQRRTGWVSEA